jgi:hypothetical protein
MATKGGILLFLTTLALLPYRVITSILAAGMAVTVFAARSWIQKVSQPGSGRRGAM